MSSRGAWGLGQLFQEVFRFVLGVSSKVLRGRFPCRTHVCPEEREASHGPPGAE